MTEKSTLEKIIHSAIDLFAEKGFHETKVDEIAEKSGLAKGTIYLYFSSKENIMEECVKLTMEKAVKNYEIDSTKTFEENLSNIITKNYNFIRENINFYKLLFNSIYRTKLKNFIDVHKIKENISNKIKDLIEKGINEGKVRKDISVKNLSELTLNLIQSSMMSITSMILFYGENQKDIDTFIKDIYAFLISALQGGEKWKNF